MLLGIISGQEHSIKTMGGDLEIIKEQVVDLKQDNTRFYIRFDGIDKRLSEMDQRFGEVDKRFDGVDQHLDSLDKKFDQVLSMLTTLTNKLQ